MRILFLFISLCFAFPLQAEIARLGTFQHDEYDRVHYFFVPANAGPETPLVIALHGMGGNAENLRFGLGLTEALADNGFAVVYPQGIRLPQGSRHWNAGFNVMDVDDVGYLAALADHLIAENGLSPDHTAVFGISMGGYMAYHMACNSTLELSAIVVVAGNMHPTDWRNCPSAGRTSLLHVHGKLDQSVPYDGGYHWAIPNGNPRGVKDVVQRWAASLGAEPGAGVLRNNALEEMRFVNFTTGREAQLITLPEFGHDWPSRVTADYQALDDIVKFLGRHRTCGDERPAGTHFEC